MFKYLGPRAGDTLWCCLIRARYTAAMRFSIRWLMAATAYAALLAAAIGTGSALLVSLVWAVPILSFCYAVIVSCVDRGRRQAMAIGFAVVSAAHVGCIYLAPYNSPARLLYYAAGYSIRSGDRIYEPTGEMEMVGRSLQRGYRRVSSPIPDVRTTNGVLTLGAGLIGCYFGSLAYRRAERS